MKKVNKKYMRMASLGLMFSFFISCSSKTEDPAPATFNGKKYTIAQGANESDHPFSYPPTINKLTFKAKFDSSAIYTTVDPLNQYDTNKLYGLSDCGTTHQINSARFGWRWVSNQLEIMAYCYIDGVRPEPVRVAIVELNKVNSYSIKFESDKYVFTVNDTNKVVVPKNCNYTGVRYRLYPYFGGNETAPHEINIWIE